MVHAQGEGFARGLHIGTELSAPIRDSVEFYHRYLDRRGVSSEQLQDLLTPYLVGAETAYPDMMNVLKGMSVGAMVPILELFAINAFEELEPLLESPEGELLFLQKKEGYVVPPITPPAVERCSSVSVNAGDVTMLAHNEHWLAGDVGNIAVIVDKPDGGRVPVASPTIVCCLPAVGMNAHGVAQGIGSLTASDDGVGVPRVLVSRSSLEARDRERCDRARGHARARGGLRPRVRVPRRRCVHAGNQRQAAPGPRPPRSAHEPLPERPRRTRARPHRTGARRGWRDCRRCSTSATHAPRKT